MLRAVWQRVVILLSCFFLLFPMQLSEASGVKDHRMRIVENELMFTGPTRPVEGVRGTSHQVLSFWRLQVWLQHAS